MFRWYHDSTGEQPPREEDLEFQSEEWWLPDVRSGLTRYQFRGASRAKARAVDRGVGSLMNGPVRGRAASWCRLDDEQERHVKFTAA